MLSKPAPWAINPARVHPRWRDFWAAAIHVAPLWDAKGTTPFDVISRQPATANGSALSEVSWVSSRYGHAVDVDDGSVDNRMNWPAPTTWADYDRPFTMIGVFIAGTPNSGGDSYFGIDSSGGDHLTFSNGFTDLGVFKITSNGQTSGEGTYAYTSGKLYTGAITFDGNSTDGLKMYVNGLLDLTITNTSSRQWATGGSRDGIGCTRGNAKTPPGSLNLAYYFLEGVQVGVIQKLAAEPFGPITPEPVRTAAPGLVYKGRRRAA